MSQKMSGNLFQYVMSNLPEEEIQTLCQVDDLRIERIVSHGHASPGDFWYDQDQDEFVMLIEGAARLHFEDNELEKELRPGDWLIIPAHTRHRVEWTTPEEPSIWLAVHY